MAVIRKMVLILAFWMLGYYASAANDAKIPTDHWNLNCANADLGDNACNPECMTRDCEFDGAVYDSDGTLQNYGDESDCIRPDGSASRVCENKEDNNGTWDWYDIATGSCQTTCNKAECGWDMEDCGVWAPNCKQEDLDNDECDQQCNTDMCSWDYGKCAYCAMDCTKSMYDNGTCDDACNTANCDWDNGSCDTTTCSSGCVNTMKGDGHCDAACYVAACDWDYDQAENINDCTICAFGCPDDYLTNGTLDSACCTASCEWDNGLCGTCANGCTQALLDNDAWDDACNVEACNYDQGQCGCESECQDDMDNNGTCDWQCLTPQCLYDFSYGDGNSIAQLPHRSGLGYNGTNYGDCNENIVKVAIAYQVLKSDFKASGARWNPANCPCSPELLVNDNCDIGCNTEACVYDMGRCWVEEKIASEDIDGNLTDSELDPSLICGTAPYVNCKFCYDNKCLLCDIISNIADTSISLFQKYTECVDSCTDILQDEDHVKNLCTATWIEKNSRSAAPKKNVVSATYTGSPEDGSQSQPYSSLSGALAEAWGLYIEIQLLKGTHSFGALDITAYPDAFSSTDQYSPLNSTVAKNTVKLTITSFLCTSGQITDCVDDINVEADRPVISLTQTLMQLLIQYETEISNVNFTTEKQLDGNCSQDSCTYCPNWTDTGSNTGRTDQDLTISSTDYSNWPAANRCELNSTINAFIEVQNLKKLKLLNVEFIKFQTGYKAIIYLNGAAELDMENVNFIRTSSLSAAGSSTTTTDSVTSAIIYAPECTEDQNEYSCSRIDYKTGKVELLNWGYEYNSELQQNGFIYGEKLVHVKIESVTFRYNMVFNNNARALIFLKDFLEFSLKTCTFEYNMAVANALIDVRNDMTSFTQDYQNGISVPDSLSHILMEGCDFKYNASHTGSLINVNFESMIQNVEIKTCKFENNISILYPLLNFAYQGNIQAAWLNDSTTQIYENGTKTQISIAKRFFTFQDNEITDNTMGRDGTLKVSKLVNLTIQNLKSSGNRDNKVSGNTSSTITSIVFDQHKSCADDFSSDCSSVLTLAPYVTKGYTITLTSQQPISCLLNVLLSENVLVTVTGSEFKTNECSEKDEQDPTYTMESSVLALNSTVEGDVISIANTVFDRNSAVREVSDLRLDIMSDIVLDTLTFQYGISQVYGAVFIQNTKQFKVEIRASTFTSNQGGISGGAHIEAGYAKLDGVTFTSNQSQRGGGFGYRNTYDGNVQLHIMNCVFTSNEATTGGAISIDDTAVTGRQHFDISATTFTSNVADYASIVNVETTVTLDVTQASLVRDCTFTSNNSRVQGGIVFASREGSITISTCTFNSNSGISGLALQFATSSQVSLTTSTFLNNSGESIISIDSFADQVIGVTQSSFTSNSGSCIYATSATLTESENTYSSNRYIIGAALLLNDAVCNASENVYTGNTAYESGGAVFVRTNASYKCEYCDMTSNTAYQGGFAYGEINSKIQIMHSRLSKNSATEQGSAIMMNTCLNDSTFINNTVWENEVGYTGTMYFLKSQMAINDTVMYNNIEKTSADSRQTPGIVGILSTITVYNSYFYNQKSTQGGSVFHISTESSLRVEQTTITNINTEDSGAVLFCLSSNATFISTTMSGLTAFSGGFALLNQNSILNLESGTSITTVSASESDSIVSAFDSTINLSGSTFTGFDNTGIFGSSLKGMTIDNCSFINSMSKEFNGGAISCDKCDAMTVRNSKFTNSTSPLGGAIYISNERSNILDGSFSITNNEFDSNQAGQGGALWADNSNILIHNNVFKNNSAGFYDFPVTISNEQESGGGVRLICTRWTTCTYDLNANTFDGNRGANSGGAISWDGTKPDGLEANTFENNEASYGAALASYPTHLVAVDENNQPLSRRLQDSNSTSITTMSNVQSGSVTDIVLRAALTDEAGTIITNDNTSTALLLSPDDGVSLTGTLQVTAVNGIFVFDNFAVIADPGTKVSFQIQTSAIELGKQNVDQNTFPIEVELRQCQIGEVLIGQSCDRCDQNTYSLDLDDTFCQDCYSDASCPGGYYILPDAGFWRPNEFYDGIFKCPNEDACLGSDNATQSLTGECATGYSGNMCQACDKDYSAGAANKCLACLDDGVNAVRLIATAIALVAIVGIMVRSSMLSAYKPKAEHSIYLKIFANYLQLVILTESFDLNWPAQVLEMREAHETAGSAGDHIISFDCYFMGEGDDASIDVYFDKLILWAVLPAGLIFCNFIIWGLMASAKRNNQILRREAVTSLVILYFLIHPDLVKQFFFALSCREIEPGERWLSKNYDIKCWEGDHLFYVLVVILPSVIVWGMGLPCVFLGMLYKNRDVLHKFGMKAKYGFLYIGYEPQAFFWEFVILYRKILIVSILVFVVPESTAVAGLCCLVVLLGSLHIQTRFLPFEKPTYNSMELRSLGVATITIYCGLFYLTDDVSNNGKLFLLAIMIISNFFFLLDWLSKMFSALFNLLREKVPFLRKCLGTPIQQDGYGDALIVKRAAHPHYWKHGTENQYSLISNLEEPLAYDKTLKIPGSITELALQDLDKARDPVDNTHREVEGQYTFGENEYPKHVTNPSVRNSDENFHSPYHESRAALQSSREKSINSARSNDRTINSARDSQESKPKSNSILDQSMHTEIDEPTLPGPVKEEQDSVKEESGSRRSTPDLDEKENQRIDE